MTVDAPFCRLTVLAPRTRVDVALPADLPVAELLPMVLELVGEPGSPRRPLPWRLSGAAGGPLPAAATLSELGVLDGDLLRVGPADAVPVAPVFDDPVDALAASAGPGGTRDQRFMVVALLLLTAAAAALLGWSTSGLAGPIIAALGAIGAVAYAGQLVRGSTADSPDAERARRTANAAAIAAVPLAAAAGWGVAGAPGGLLLAAAAAGVAAAAGQVVLRVVAPVLIATVVGAVLLAAAAVAVRFGSAPEAAGAAVAVLAIVAGPMLPRLALRLAGMPRPLVPADGDELIDADDGSDLLPPGELAERAALARGYLAGLVGGCAVIAAVGAAVTAAAGGWAGPAFAGLTTVVLGLRSRHYADRGPARTSLLASIATAAALAVLLGARDAVVARPVVAATLLLAAAIGLLAMNRPPGPGSPVARRAVDWLEAGLVALSVPLAFGAMDLYRIVRGM